MRIKSIGQADEATSRPRAGGPTIVLLVAWMFAITGVRSQDRVTSFLAVPGDAQVTLTWAPAFQASGYNVKQGASASGPFKVIAMNVSESRYLVTSLTNDRPYYFAVSSVADEFESASTPGLRAMPSAAVLDLLPAGAKVEKLASGFRLTEGPVWNPAEGGFLIFSDVDGNRLLRWSPRAGITTFRQPSQRANGNTLDLQGRLITCQQATRSVTRTETDGTLTPLVTEYNGRRFNEPNDVVVKSDGTVWFTDPTYNNPQTQPGQYVYRFDPEVGNASVAVVATTLSSPNGLCFSPDETRLYVGNALQAGFIRVFDVLPDNSLTNGRLFTQLAFADGIRADRRGRVYASAALSPTLFGVQVFDANGQLLDHLRLAELPRNLCFGGINQELLFVTAGTSLYGITRMPDLVVTATYGTPANPTEGQRVTFSAVVKNQGTAPTPAGQVARLSFSLDGATNVSWSATLPQSIPPDASVLVTVNAGSEGTLWTATAGSHSLQAAVDDLNQVTESIETNNSHARGLSVSTIPADSDGDGLDDASETVAGTDPQDRTSVLRITSIEPEDADHLTLTWSSVPGRAYCVARSSSLAAPGWATCLNRVIAPGGGTSLTRTVTVTHELNFYRVLVVP